MTMIWPLMTFLDLLTSRIVSITITKNIGVLHIKSKLKTAVLQWKYVQTSERSNEWPQADLHWPLMTSKLSILEHMHDVYQKKEEHLRIPYVRNFFLFWTIWPLMIMIWPLITFFLPFDLSNNYNYYNYKKDRHVAYQMKVKDKSIFELCKFMNK